MHTELLVFLLTKPAPRLVGARCTSRRFNPGTGLAGFASVTDEMSRCTRPVWGDGKGIAPDGFGEGLCSRCFHEFMAFNGRYTMMQANPAASLLSGDKIASMPDIFGLPDTFPTDWV